MSVPVLGARVGLYVLDVVRGSLSLRCCMDEERGVVAQDRHPALEVRSAVGDRDVRHPAHAAEV